jgi:hypothetical protein
VEEVITETPLRWGYTLGDLDQIAHLAVRTDHSHHAGSYDDRHAVAWYGAVEKLYSADREVDWRGLVNAARNELARDAAANRRHHSLDDRPRAYAYWWDMLSPTRQGSHEAGVVDRIALRQIWPTLSTREREAFTALAACEDYQAAELLDASYYAFQSALTRGRRRFLRFWHQGEAPSGMWGNDRRVGVRGRVGGGRASIHRNLRRRSGVVTR